VGELKHLSNPRKREHSPSSGERKGNSPNLCCVSPWALQYRGCRTCQGALRSLQEVTKLGASKTELERRTIGGDSPVCESASDFWQ
jgi:hypothetical protein